MSSISEAGRAREVFSKDLYNKGVEEEKNLSHVKRGPHVQDLLVQTTDSSNE
jgi:hypothetical protein